MPPQRKKKARSTGGLNFPLPKIESVTPTRFTAYIYGFSGAGKTYMLREVAKPPLSPALIMVCDEGQASFQDLITEDKITAVATTDLTAISDIFNWLVRIQEAGKLHYKTIVIDNISELHRDTLRWHAENRASGNSGKSDFEHTQSDYGNARTQIMSVVASFVKTFREVNFIVTSTASRTQDAITGMTYIDPGLPGKLSQEIPGFFDLVGFLEMRQPHPSEVRKAKASNITLSPSRVLVVDQTNTISSARCRGGVFTGEVINPSFTDFHSKFTGAQ